MQNHFVIANPYNMAWYVLITMLSCGV